MFTVTKPWIKTVAISVLSAICAGGIIAAICVGIFTNKLNNLYQEKPVDGLEYGSDGGLANISFHPSLALLLTEPSPSSSLLKSFPTAAVAVDSTPCSKIGRNVLSEEGTAVDAAVAVLFCNSVVTSQSMGLGGGFLMTISLANGTRVALVAREMAPAGANSQMFANASSTIGPLSAGVPGEVMGYWEAKQRYGNPKISWRRLIEPSKDLCNKGVKVSAHQARSLKKAEKYIKTDPGLSSVYLNKKTNELLKEGETYKNPALGITLDKIANLGADEFYKGEIAELLVKDIQDAGGIISTDDMANYRVSWEEPVSVKIPNSPYTILSSPPPGSGIITASILGILGTYRPDPLDKPNSLFWHRFIESCKFAFAKRTLLADWHNEEYGERVRKIVQELSLNETLFEIANKISDVKTSTDVNFYGAEFTSIEDAGTAHMSILSPAGDAVSVTSTVNLLFGSKFMSPSTGIIMNNQMDDFSYPGIVNSFGVRPSPANYPAPGKRPLSSMSPSIVLDDKNRVVAVAGASGGTKIITTVAQVLLRMLFLGDDVKTAIDARRLHHQLMPMKVKYEAGTTKWTVRGLEKYGHDTEPYHLGESIVQAIKIDPDSGKITANADFRKQGTVDGF